MFASRHEELSATHYDMYKDVHGVRPRWVDYDALSVQELEKMLDDLFVQLGAEMARPAAAEKKSIEIFEAWVSIIIASGAGNRETALQWIMDANDVNGDWDHLCYNHGLPFGYFKEVA